MRWWTLYTEERLISVVLKKRGGMVEVRVCLVLLVEDTSSFGKGTTGVGVFIAQIWIDSVVMWSETMSGSCM